MGLAKVQCQTNLIDGLALYFRKESYLLGWPVSLTSLIKRKIAAMNTIAYEISSPGFSNCSVLKSKCRNRDIHSMTAIIVKMNLTGLLYKLKYVKGSTKKQRTYS